MSAKLNLSSQSNNASAKTTKPRNQYFKEIVRLESFLPSKWPLDYIDSKDLARTGFYYRGPGDRVSCYFCGLNLCNWQRTDSVLGEHLKWAPSCPLIRRRNTNNIPIDAELLDRTLPPHSIDECGYSCGVSYHTRSPQEQAQISDTLIVNHASSILDDGEYRTPSERLASFSNWPKSIKQTGEDLAEAGFFYTGRGDIVVCYKCGVTISDWEEGDDPWVKHAKKSENCPHVRLIKGTDFVTAALSELSTQDKQDKDKIKDTNKKAVETNKLFDDSPTTGEGSNICKICLNNPLDTVFLPCAHVAACANCALAVEKCPVCRRSIDDIKKVYLT